jgi:hypothetical protein
MSEWWTYELADFLMFAPRTYYRLFELYNRAVWPLHVLAAILGLAIPLLALRAAWQGRLVAAILAACWLWVAWAFLHERYATINWAADYFAIGFALQALLIAWRGLLRDRLRLHPTPVGMVLLLFAILVQPMLGPLLGRDWWQHELFGLAPDPTVVATLGVLLLAPERPPWELLPIPLAWCAIGGATLWTLQAPDALVLPGVGILAAALMIGRRLRRVGKRQLSHGPPANSA